MSAPIYSSASPARDRREWIVVALVAGLLIVVFPALHVFGLISNFTIGLWGKYL